MYNIDKQKNGRYAVKKIGSSRASKTFDSYQEAMIYCTKMNNKKGNSKASNKNKKTKKNSFKTICLLLLIIIVCGISAFVFIKYVKPHINNKSEASEGVIFDDFQIHFMMLGNDNAGDSIYIKAGDTDVIIDAGSKQDSSITTMKYMNKYISDGKIEYVILTHGDSDHVSGFTNTSSNKGILSSYQIDVIIDNKLSNKTTKVYNNYLTLRNALVNNGTKHYYASDCYNNQNGASREYKLSDKVTMSILYNYFYFNESKDENNYSICTMFAYKSDEGTKYFMLTGDLELEGEENMAQYYDGSSPEKTLPEVELFKAGHHGSKTSSNDCLLSIIKPKMSVVSCCCGTDEYTENLDNQFPTQQFISRISKYTDAVYVTSIYASITLNNNSSTTTIDTKGYKALNGNIIVSCENSQVGIWASNNLTKLKDTEWFNMKVIVNGKERTMRVWG